MPRRWTAGSTIDPRLGRAISVDPGSAQLIAAEPGEQLGDLAVGFGRVDDALDVGLVDRADADRVYRHRIDRIG